MTKRLPFLTSGISRISRLLPPLLISLLFASVLCGCAMSSAERASQMQREGDVLGFSPVRYGARPPLAGMLREAPHGHGHAIHDDAAHALWVVIEGDGRAWLNIHQVSPDPTPRDAAGWRLAKDLSAHNVLYLARPCQFLRTAELDACTADDWTDARFSEKWVARMNAAISTAKASGTFSKIILSGYSGGGVMAALIAARRDDVLALITVAAPLDHAAWTAYHGVSPLTGSLSVVAVRDKLLHLPQLLIGGADDDIVPPVLTRNFLQAYPSGVPAEMITLPGVDHRMRTTIDLSNIRSSTLPWPTTDDPGNGRGLPDRSPLK